MEKSFKEQRIRNATHLYYSRPEIQKAIFEFSKNREISPRYFEGFGKRPDSFQYKGDVFELVNRGATSFHSSEEIWSAPLELSTELNEQQLNNLRTGWDFLIDIDCKWIDYSKLAAKAIIETLKRNGIKNIGIKFSGSKGFHIIVPWKSFPKEINGEQTSNLFPDLPRKLAAYVRFMSEKVLKEILPHDFESQFKGIDIKRGIKCKKCNEIVNEFDQIEFYCSFCKSGEIRKLQKDQSQNLKCPTCKREFIQKNKKEYLECTKCSSNSNNSPHGFMESVQTDLYELMGLDILLVSPRHLFRMPYSLHEKTALASVVLTEEELDNFDLTHANPMKFSDEKIKNFYPEAEEGEAAEILTQALDWAKQNEIENPEETKKVSGKFAEFKPIELNNITEDQFPPCTHNILKGITDGRKRALFALINLFRSVGMDKELMEKKIQEWNQKNEVPIKEGYIKSQLSWSYRKKPILPPNCKEFYQGIACCTPDGLCPSIKNPVNYVVRKNFAVNKKKIKKK